VVGRTGKRIVLKTRCKDKQVIEKETEAFQNRKRNNQETQASDPPARVPSETRDGCETGYTRRLIRVKEG